MTLWARLPIRFRLSLAFGASVAAVVGGLSVFVYGRTGADLLDTIDQGLSSRAEVLVSGLQQHGPSLVNVGSAPVDDDRGFAQIADWSGRVLRSTPSVAPWRLLPPRAFRSLRQAAFFDRKIAGVDDLTRVLAVPAETGQGRFVVMVGASLQDRRDQLVELAATLAIAGSAAFVLISAGAWLAIAGALRPVERMRRQAAAITASDPGRRLDPAGGRDEIALLGATLNQMLDRVGESVANERRLVDRASHELRTPLAIQRIELDVALSGPQTVEELTNALASVSAENAQLTRLTEDLLVLSRARGGVLPVRLAEVALPELLDDARRRHGLLNGGGVQVGFHAPDRVVRVDPVWFRQAVDNLVDNAVRHTPPGGRVEVRADRQGDTLSVVVEDTGPGFDQALLGDAFRPFTRSRGDRPGSAGLGLTVVDMIARAHGGRAWAENRPEGGARVTMAMNADLVKPRSS